MSPSYRRLNPRIDRRFDVKIKYGEVQISGRTTKVSSFGATVELSEDDYRRLQEVLRLPFLVGLSTSLNDLEGEINAMYQKDGQNFIGLKLLNGRTWYS